MLILNSSGLRVGLERAQPGHVLGGLPVHHLAVVERGPDQHARDRRCGARLCRGSSVFMYSYCSRIFGIAPLLELAHRERQRLVEHGVDHVHERHLRSTAAVNRSGRMLSDRAHQQAARAAALDHQPVRRGVAAAATRCSAHGDEVGEGVPLVHHPARRRATACPARRRRGCGRWRRRTPRSSRLSRLEENVDRVRDAVGAVAVEQQRARAVARRRPARHTSEIGIAGAVGGRRVDALGAVARRVVAAQHLASASAASRCPRRHVVVEDRGGRDQRLVAEPVARRCRTPRWRRRRRRRPARGTRRGASAPLGQVGDAQPRSARPRARATT